MTVSIDALAFSVQADAPSLPTYLAQEHILAAAREFCRETRAWTAEITGLSITEGQLTVSITPPTDGVLIDIKNAVYDETLNLTKQTRTQLNRDMPGWRTDAGAPKYILLGDSINQLIVAPLPDATHADLVVEGIFQPTRGATELDELLIDTFGEIIIAGAKARVMRMPSRPWSSSTLAAMYDAVYMDGMVDAKSKAANGRMTGVSRTVRYGGI